MNRPRILFLCTGNSCRSQMAEGLLRHLAARSLEALSAGTRPQGVNPGAVRAMAAIGIDIKEQCSQSIDEFLDDPPDLVISVCDSAASACPTFPGSVRRQHWPFPDPADAVGNEDEIASAFADVRDAIRTRIEEWLALGAPLEAYSA